MLDDADVQQALDSIQLADEANRETIYLTLLAIYILQEAFPDYEDEWTLIVRKARNFLEEAGVQKPSNLVKKFTLTVLD